MAKVKKISENLSSNTLFHFTNKLEYVIDILTNTFKPRYCLEDLTIFTSDNQSSELAIPMVCFCDIPLSKIKVHISKYGDYALGLTKKWGLTHGLSPILYSEKDSRTAQLIRKLFTELIFTARGVHKTIDNSEDLIVDIIRYTKPYQGKMWRHTKYVENIRFYDEREWRYVPDTISKNMNSILTKEMFFDAAERMESDTLLSETFSIPFTPDDIKYLILRSEREIDRFIDELNRIKSPSFNSDVVKKLTTRIITKEQILYDF